MSETLRKARRQLLIWSGLLVIWVYVGIDPTKMGGTLGDVAKAISNPRALPVCLFIIVAFLMYRWCHEWMILAEADRTSGPNRVDAVVTFSVGWVALASGVLYLVVGPDPLRPIPFARAASIPLVSAVAAFAGVSRARRLASGLRIFRSGTLHRLLLVNKRPHAWSASDHMMIWGFVWGESSVFSSIAGLVLIPLLYGAGMIPANAADETAVGFLTSWLVMAFVVINYIFLPRVLLTLGLIRKPDILVES